jgi:transposase InsO family protein
MPGSPWENGYCEGFNSKLWDELLNGEIFYTLKEAKIIIESWRRHYNTIRPHSSVRHHPPAPEVLQWPAAQHQPASPATPALATNQIVN